MDRILLLSDQPDPAIADPDRLLAVAATGLLDSPPEQVFDRLTRLAARLIGAPVTFLSLIDNHRDFYKSHCGFGEPLASTRQLDGRTFCHFTLVSDGPLVIDDVTAHPLFREVPTVKSLAVRAYAGIPLVLDGHNIGSFCAIDFAPRAWSELDVETLQELANAAMREISLRRLAQEAQQNVLAREAILIALEQELPNALSMVNMALHAIHGSTSSMQAGLIADARDANNAVIDMTRQLLELARLQSGRASLRREPYDAAGLLQDAVGILAPTSARRGITLVLDTLPIDVQVAVDYQYLLRALCQLIGHAIQISPDGGHVRVALTSDLAEVRLAISDQGPKFVAHADELDASDAAHRGSGLAFSIAKALIEAHGGQLQVDCTDETGNLVHVTLPLNPTA